jgi:hypothetical protein
MRIDDKGRENEARENEELRDNANDRVDEPRFTPINGPDVFTIETREDYLRDPQVRSFTDFLAGLLGEGAPMRHAWRHAATRLDWQCESLLDAVWHYWFPVVKQFRHLTGLVDFESLQANALVLEDLKRRLRDARVTKNEYAVRAAARDIQMWGGTDRGDHNSRAIDALGTEPGGFLGYLDRCHLAFGIGDALDLSPFHVAPGFRSNSGFAKIYALAFDEFAIFDSRVAAALGLMIVRWWALNGEAVPLIPMSLRILCMPTPTYRDPRRNPKRNVWGIGGFPVAQRGGNQVHLLHLQSNIHVNWILRAALQDSAFEAEVLKRPHPFGVVPLRALEAALFMIGYDLAGNWPHAGS